MVIRFGNTAVRIGTVGTKSHDPCFHVFLMEARVMTFVVHCTHLNDMAGQSAVD